ncbi:MAG: bifunctional 5,10-methylene-tetrahydrofolate dehydrogenase/5,10-methylene-tetrahydrofolate cyclohydrolase [Treponema sp.]|jgi:methylenetetrahydrofolate dehydrogenase (NADP+)/methenyltetrahydrofolate cyclohydrolase|nr:bifunctional 5,10-methylene-tetrahydrofolate dehydrogenase/5,10-methylene-tetrahydrofolate cyclohydrolase [Treponema sp.]
MADIIDGREYARKKREEAAHRTAALKEKGITPCLGLILVGEEPAGISYVAAKEKALLEAGMESRDIRLSRDVSEEEILTHVVRLNRDPRIHGILVQLPLPNHIREDRIIAAIDPNKDVDGFHPVSVGNLVLGKPGFLPCTPHGVLVLLEEIKIPVAGAHVVIVGRSNIVGKPLAQLFVRREINATVTICHTGTGDLRRHTCQADILVAAAGKAGLITADMVKEGAVVIDVGVNRISANNTKKGYRLTGDVDFDAVAAKASYITPVPGGVGPMTVAMLLLNVVSAAAQFADANCLGVSTSRNSNN